MGDCVFCGKPAGFFSSMHAECEQAEARKRRDLEEEARATVERTKKVIAHLGEMFCQSIRLGVDMAACEAQMTDLAAAAAISPARHREALVAGWKAALAAMLDDRVITEEEEQRLVTAKEHFALPQSDLDADGSYTRLAMAVQMRHLAAGKMGIAMKPPPGFPVQFERWEYAVWSFQPVQYLSERQRRSSAGLSQGVSVRVAGGVYLRLGAFGSRSVSAGELAHLDDGLLCLGSKNLYFVGGLKSVRIPYRKIITLQPYSDGVGVHCSGATAKLQAFRTAEPWALYNFTSLLCKR